MKINEVKGKLELSGIDSAEINYSKIAANSVIMSILGDKLYKYKIQSTVREIISNAIDASFEAKTKKPIEVHCPTLLEPWFSVKDYGIGMSEDTLVDVFFNYGESTKRQTNKLIGGFGIGAKVAGVYSGQFSVTSIKDGNKSIYQFFKDKDGMPCNTCLYRGTSDEPNGTEIKIAANKASDFKEFEKHVGEYTTWTDYPFKINCQVNNKMPEFSVKEKNFAIKKHVVQANSYFQDTGYLTVVIGGIPYPVNVNSVDTSFTYGYPIYKDFIVLFANIGDVSLIASREEVEYTDKTKAYIKNALVKIKEWYATYKASKTKFWLYQNKEKWETESRYSVEYGFEILYKNSKYTKSKSGPAFKHYVLVDDFGARPWKSICDKINSNPTNTAFVLKTDKQKLLDLGCEPSTIYELSKLPKAVRQKRGAYKVLTVNPKTGNLKLGYASEIDSTYKPILSKEYYSDYEMNRFMVEQIKLGHKFYINDSVPSELKKHVESVLGKETLISYDNVANFLCDLKYIKKKCKDTDTKNNRIRQSFGLLKTGNFHLTNEFPLMSNLRGHLMHSLPKLKSHAINYVNTVIAENPKILNSEFVEVLALKL